MIKSKIKENVSLASMTSFKIGGIARYFVEISSKEELPEIFDWITENKLEYILFSGGTNVLINDNEFKGIVIKIANKGVDLKGERIEAGAGAEFSQVVRKAVSADMTGLEWAVGIPGSLGGAVRGNAGAFGLYISDSVETVEVFNIKKGKFEMFSTKDCVFDYRESVFKKDKDLLIWKIILKLKKGDPARIKDDITRYIEYRNKTQPKLPSAGCIFKNVPFEVLKNGNLNLAKAAEKENVVKGGKVGAGWIIDRLGLKGKTIGGTKISLEHASFIVNTGGAKAEEVVMMISYIKQQVRDEFGVQLQEEIEYLGF